MSKNFKSDVTFAERVKQSSDIMAKYPDRIPVYVSKRKHSKYEDIDKHKYLVPKDITISQFLYIIRKRLKLESHQAIFVFIDNTLPPSSELISSIYDRAKDLDGFLYVEFSHESVFG